MKPTQVLVALAAIAYAAPVSDDTKAKALEIDDDFPLAELEAYFEAHMNGETSEANSLHARQFSSSTYNQLTDGTPCRPVTMIYARGTTQAGNVGDPAAVGPVLFNNLASRIGLNNLAVQGVAYPANIAGYLAGGDAAGSRTMADLISRAATQCPSTKIIISGYSQGAQLVHNAAGMLSASVTNRVTAAVTFGDPKQKQAFGTIPSSRTRIFCRAGDNICDGGIIVTPAHSQYQQDAPAAAEWIAARSDPYYGAQVFVANINTMSHKVEWIFLKIKNSYHDNIERLAISKWAPQLSAEINLPDWVEDELREILIYEIIKTHMTQPFNRYSWIILRNMFGHDFDHHGKSATFLGHVFSVIAKIVLQTEDVDQQFWLDNMHLLTLGCFEIINDKTVDFTQGLLSDAGRLKAFFTPLLISAFPVVNGKLKNDEKTNSNHKKLRKHMTDRKSENSSTLIKDEADFDDEDGPELKVEEEEEELGTRRTITFNSRKFNSVP
ncbi:unnamed protein product [Fusarium graminearum]|nr:unnamed protein product [Fusarium graminearum]